MKNRGDMRFLKRYKVLLLSMTEVFMFRDEPKKGINYWPTYQQLGGSLLNERELQTIMAQVVRELYRQYENPKFFKIFPLFREYLSKNILTKSLPQHERDILDDTFALHEVGEISDEYADVLYELSQTHELALVENTWSNSKWFKAELRRAGVDDLFRISVFSSDYGIVKPCPQLICKAVSAFDVPRSKILYIGSHWRCDVNGAINSGLDSVWVSPEMRAPENEFVRPTYMIADLKDLVETESHIRVPNKYW